MGTQNYTSELIEYLERKIKVRTVKKSNHNYNRLINDYPYKNIITEIKPSNSGLFILDLTKFEFFDYNILESYLTGKLQHDKINFILNNRRIYIYPQNKNNVAECIEALEFAAKITLDAISRIKTTLTLPEP